MSKIYSTEELIRVLADERKACMNGQRLTLAGSPSGNPAIDFFLQAEGLQRFTAYQDFRSTVHQYQREHQVSGIVWQTLTVHGRSLRFPKVDDQLIALPSDVALLQAARPTLYAFWQAVTVEMDFYLSLNGGKVHQPIAEADIDRIWQRSQWLSLQRQGKDTGLELILQLGWGRPEAAAYRRGFPESGSEYVHAVYPGQRPLS